MTIHKYELVGAMRALRLEEFGRLAVVDVPEPVAGPGEIVIETVATGVCGSDIHGYTGHNGRRVPGQIMGHESVGRIHSLGEGVDAAAYPIGAPATVNPVVLSAAGRDRYRGREQHDPERSVLGVDPARLSAFASRFPVPAENVVVLPESMPIAYGALIEPLAVGLNGVRRAGLREGDSVLVIGGGPIGT
jgi:threonine dehydrogenase-like Zn-dependent dehydrogenase